MSYIPEQHQEHQQHHQRQHHQHERIEIDFPVGAATLSPPQPPIPSFLKGFDAKAKLALDSNSAEAKGSQRMPLAKQIPGRAIVRLM